MKKAIWLDEDSLPKWDAFVEKHPLGGLCQNSTWKRVMESSFRHVRGRFCAVVDSETNEILAGIPLYRVKSWLLDNRLVSIPFATLCDPLCSSTQDLELLMPLVYVYHRESSPRFIEIRTLRAADMFVESQLRSSHSYLHHFVDMSRPLENIRRNLGRTAVRQMIAKAEKLGFRAREAENEEDLKAFYSLLCQTRRRLSLPPIPFRFFKSVWAELADKGYLTVVLAELDGKIRGAAMALKRRDTFLLEYAGDDGQLRKAGIVQFLYWEAMKQAHREGYSIFSFGRTARGNKPLIRSKSHWGTEVEDLCTFFYPRTIHKDAEDREASAKYRLIKAIAAHAPEPVYRLLGEFCYRHMG